MFIQAQNYLILFIESRKFHEPKLQELGEGGQVKSYDFCMLYYY